MYSVHCTPCTRHQHVHLKLTHLYSSKVEFLQVNLRNLTFYAICSDKRCAKLF